MGMFNAGRSVVFYVVGAVLVVAGALCLTRYGVETPGTNSTAQYVAWTWATIARASPPLLAVVTFAPT